VEYVVADANGTGFTCNSPVANVNIIITSGKIGSGSTAHCNVVAARCVVIERLNANGGVTFASVVQSERLPANSRVESTGCVA
jgi:hypothetical protein